MAYRALYRVYRPSLFGEVAGQEHITSVLKNQVHQDRLSHAYLFCGPRGTGKTSTAKILARAANCLNNVNGEPCGECAMCKAASRASSDIVEIDAASNNGVDNVRDLISQAQFAPLELKKRVFIIDEVHMLSTSAFNALLKTLEEPPEHILFILATTEPQKLLATIVSRCQRFDFRHIRLEDIVSYMKKVLLKEGVSSEDDALRLVAHAAGGGMRDALSLLNQCLSVSGSSLTAEAVRDVLGVAEEDFLFAITEHILNGKGKECLGDVEEIVRQGRDLSVFTNDLSQHIRALLLTETCGKCADLLECTEETAARYEKQAKETSKERLLYLAEQLISVRTDMKYFPNPRFLLETVLLRMAFPSGENDQNAILSRISALENNGSEYIGSKIKSLEAEIQLLKNNSTVSAKKDSVLVTNSSAEDLPPWDYIPEPPPEEAVLTGISYTANETDTDKKISDLEQDSLNDPTIPARNNTVTDEGMNIFRQLIGVMARANPMIGMTMKSLDGARLNGDRLVLLYSKQNSAKCIMLNRPNMMHSIQQELEKIRPGTSVTLFEEENADSPGVEKLRKLFGDKLTLE